MVRYHSNGCLTIDIQRSSEIRAITYIVSARQTEIPDYRMFLIACPNNASDASTIVDDFDSLFDVQPGEVMLMLLLVAVWGCAVAYFLYKWRSMRIIQPSETMSKPYCPKNLETIKVVARHRDSVIYKSYSENMSRTMQARQKRLDRMNTMPNIKVGEMVQLSSPILRTKSLDVTAEGFNRRHGLPSTGENRSASTSGGGGISTFIDLANSCSNIMSTIQMGVLSAPIMEVEEESEAQTEC